VATGEADVGIATEAISLDERLVCLPCYQWNRCIVVPHQHPILDKLPLTLETIASYPLITYDYAFTGGTLVSKVFEESKVTPNVVLTAIDSDVIKTYVSLGLGIGLIANMAYDEARDGHLTKVDCSHLFPDSTTFLGVRKDAFIREYMLNFMQLLAPDINRSLISEALQMPK
jgi:LysR family transcriptional regulator, cys regulon transcriptional activator